MSSKGRGTTTENWETPYWTVRRLLEEVDLPAGKWLEPMAGNGRIMRAVNEDRPGGIEWHAFEQRESCGLWLRQVEGISRLHVPHDSLAQPIFLNEHYDVGIMNPAFSSSFDILQKMLVCCDKVAMLQRINWLGSGTNNGKHQFLLRHHPDVYQLPDRVKFLLNGRFPRHPPGAKDPNGRSIAGHLMSGDSIEYAWFVFDMDRVSPKGIIAQLRETAEEERLKLEEDDWGMAA